MVPLERSVSLRSGVIAVITAPVVFTLACAAGGETGDSEGGPSACVPAAEIPYDAVDQDFDGADLTDVDADGYASVVVGGEDCDDEDASVSPDAPEVSYDGRDNDCDASTPDDDADGDGVGLAADCDDADPWRSSGSIFVSGPVLLDGEDAVAAFCQGACDATIEGDLRIQGVLELGRLRCLVGVTGSLEVHESPGLATSPCTTPRRCSTSVAWGRSPPSAESST